MNEKYKKPDQPAEKVVALTTKTGAAKPARKKAPVKAAAKQPVAVTPLRKNIKVNTNQDEGLGDWVNKPYMQEIMRAQALDPLNTLDYEQVTRLIGESGERSPDDPLRFTPQFEAQLRNLVLNQFCFPRLPETWIEFDAVLNQIESLGCAWGVGHADSYRKSWQESALRVFSKFPTELPAVKAHLSGDSAGLLRAHSEERSIEKLAAERLIAADYDDTPGNPSDIRNERTPAEKPHTATPTRANIEVPQTRVDKPPQPRKSKAASNRPENVIAFRKPKP